VGGVERKKQELERVAGDFGWDLDYHGGHLQGRGRGDIETYVGRADLVIVATAVNSHGAVTLARSLAAHRGVPFELVSSCSPSALRGILDRRQAAAPSKPPTP
jgi:hypothetical protein